MKTESEPFINKMRVKELPNIFSFFWELSFEVCLLPFFISRFALLFFHMHFAVINYFFSKLLLVVTILKVSIYFWIGFCNGKNNNSVLIVIYKQCFSSFNIVPHLHWHLPCYKYLTVTYINTKNGYENRKGD